MSADLRTLSNMFILTVKHKPLLSRLLSPELLRINGNLPRLHGELDCYFALLKVELMLGALFTHQ